MPLLRQSLYSQNVNLYLAPTADPRETWLPLMQTIACEGRAFVMSANQCTRRKDLPPWILDGKDGAKSKEEAVAAATAFAARRRESVVTKTEENHEIMWPNPVDVTKTTNGDAPHVNGKGSQPVVSRPSNLRKSMSVISSDDDELPPISSSMHEEKTSGGPDGEEFLSRGGSCIVSPFGEVLAGPLWEVEEGGLLAVEVDFEDCERGRFDLDVAGSYSRNDAFKLTVDGLDLNPPP